MLYSYHTPWRRKRGFRAGGRGRKGPCTAGQPFCRKISYLVTKMTRPLFSSNYVLNFDRNGFIKLSILVIFVGKSSFLPLLVSFASDDLL